MLWCDEHLALFATQTNYVAAENLASSSSSNLSSYLSY
jgi:hypothetical protein